MTEHNYIVLTEERVKELITQVVSEMGENHSTVDKDLQEILDDPIQDVYDVTVE